METAQENKNRADTETEKKGTKKNIYSESLCYVIWSNKLFVSTLSNFHAPNVVDEGLKKKRKIISFIREWCGGQV